MTSTGADLAANLEQSPLFEGYSRKEIAKLSEAFDEQTFLADRRIVSEGLTGMDFFLILDGIAEVTRDGRVVATLQPGDFFGEIAVLDDGPRTASVRTDSQVRCLSLPNGALKQFLLENPRFCLNVMKQVVRRFRAEVTSAKQNV